MSYYAAQACGRAAEQRVELRIIEKLKTRAYYPRELAAEMKLSEPFVVRRLKAMEEFDIVEGRRESEGSRKVKRYYLKDVTLQLGKGGLEVASGDVEPVAPGGEISIRKEALRLLIVLPFFLAGMYFNLAHMTVPYVAVCLLIVWYFADVVVFYRNYRHSTLVVMIFILAPVGLAEAFNLALYFTGIDPVTHPNEDVGVAWLVWIILLLVAYTYYIRLSRAEVRDLTEDKKDFVAGLDSASSPVKIFYLPLAFIWKINEYFGLH